MQEQEGREGRRNGGKKGIIVYSGQGHDQTVWIKMKSYLTEIGMQLLRHFPDAVMLASATYDGFMKGIIVFSGQGHDQTVWIKMK